MPTISEVNISITDQTVFPEFGCSKSQAKTKRICRIIESDSEESDSENKKIEESDQKKLSSNKERTETEDVSKILTQETEQVEEQSVENVVESIADRDKIKKRRHSLMYSTTDDEDDMPLVKLKSLIKNSKNSIDEISINKALRRTRSSPRVILEKLEIPETTHSSDDESEIDLESTKLTPETKRPQRTRQSHNTEAKKKTLPRKGKNNVITDNKRDKTPESDKEYVNDKTVSLPSATGAEVNDQLSIPEIINDPDVEQAAENDCRTIDVASSDNEENSLLEIDVKPELNYYLYNKNKYDCRLCDYRGKFIVHHYKNKHPESENMISRLRPDKAEAAKLESETNHFELINAYEEIIRGKKRRTNFSCRFCSLNFKQEFASTFFDHICVHTGEYRYKCEKCNFWTGIRKNLSAHYYKSHPEMKKPITINPIYPCSPNFRLLFGYICCACNFTQLLKINVEKHIKVSHPDQDVKIVKVSMSSKPVPLDDLKEKKNDQETVDGEAIDAEAVDFEQELIALENLLEEFNTEENESQEKIITEKPKEIKAELEPSEERERDMTVFMESDDISMREKLIESERLKKMNEVINKISPRQSRLQFKTELDSTMESGLNEEFRNEELGIQSIDSSTAQEKEKSKSSDENVDKELKVFSFSIANTYLEEENNLHAKTATVSPPKEPEKIYPQPKITVPLSEKQILIPVPSLSNSFKIIWKENGKASAGATTSTSENDNIINNMRALFSGKHVEIITDMMKYPKLNDLYKCPDSNCAFSTSDAVGFSAHFHSHNFAPVGKYCVYCTTNIEAASATLINHIHRYHSHCLYQCSYCFFRAILPTYIITHQNLLHKPFKLQMHILPPIIYKNKPQTVEPLARNHTILPIECKQDNCKHMYLTIDDFIQHVHIIHNIFKCSMCDLTTLATRTHLAYHNIGLYQCRFCLFGAQEPEEMYKHYALVHYYVRPIAYIRQFKTNSKISLYPKDRLAAIETIDLEAKVDEKSKFPNCKYLVNNSILTKLSKDTVPAAADISKPPLPFEPGEVPQTNPVIQVIDLREDVTTEARASEILPISKDLEEPEVTIKYRTVEAREAIANAVDPLNLDQEMPFEIDEPNLNFDQVPSRIQSENDDKKLDENLVDNSDTVVYSNSDDGLNGYELYKCGTPNCFFKASNIKDFENHMYFCNLLKTYDEWYICIHCEKRFKSVGGLVDHIQIHGPKRFSCSLCNCKAPLNHIIAKHMKNKHKIFNVKIVPIDPQKSDMNLDRFIAMPSKTTKPPKDQQFAATITNLESESSSSNCLRTEEKTIFGPEDIDLLPRPPVYYLCKLCSYETKVRSNMLRHLQGHMDEKSVPETALVNPVPCLEKNEKMTNLAASSHTTGRMGGKYVDKSDKGLTNLEESTYPVFIPVNKRYVCGAKGCNYLTHGDAMFRCHFTALHFDEITYKCPHCQIELSTELEGVSIGNILFHLKMHDLHLYKCNYCDFYHYQRHKTKRHVSESHPDRPVTIQTIRELESSANLEDNRPPLSPKTVESVDSQEAKPWHCGFCPYRSVSRSDIQNHAARIHDIKSQYKCGLCHFQCSARNNYNSHFKTKHPNSEIDIISFYYKTVEESSSPLKNVVPEVVSDPEIFDTLSLKRPASQTKDEPPSKKIKYDSTNIVVPSTSSVAKQSTTQPSTTPNVQNSNSEKAEEEEGFTYYGTEPCDINKYKHMMSKIDIMGKSTPITVGTLALIFDMCPTVLVEDIYKKSTT